MELGSATIPCIISTIKWDWDRSTSGWYMAQGQQLSLCQQKSCVCKKSRSFRTSKDMSRSCETKPTDATPSHSCTHLLQYSQRSSDHQSKCEIPPLFHCLRVIYTASYSFFQFNSIYPFYQEFIESDLFIFIFSTIKIYESLLTGQKWPILAFNVKFSISDG